MLDTHDGGQLCVAVGKRWVVDYMIYANWLQHEHCEYAVYYWNKHYWIGDVLMLFALRGFFFQCVISYSVRISVFFFFLSVQMFDELYEYFGCFQHAFHVFTFAVIYLYRWNCCSCHIGRGFCMELRVVSCRWNLVVTYMLYVYDSDRICFFIFCFF